MPDVDLFVRSSGEQRTSNFLLWQSAYAEMVFLNTLWPDFDRRNLWQAIEIYAEPRPSLRRRRRPGVNTALRVPSAAPGGDASGPVAAYCRDMPPASPDVRGGSQTRDTRSPSNSSTASNTWDVVVIGGGPAGENAADYAIRGSDRTAVIVENELVGGECSYWACIPSKTLLRSVEVFGEAEVLQGTATRLSTKGIDVKAVLGRRDAFTSHLDDAGQVKWAKGAGIDVLRGHGRLTGTRTVQVADSDGPARDITARHAVSSPRAPPRRSRTSPACGRRCRGPRAT